MKTLNFEKLMATIDRTMKNAKTLRDNGASEKDLLPLLVKIDTLVTLAGFFEETEKQ
jgi:hypothetical protein